MEMESKKMKNKNTFVKLSGIIALALILGANASSIAWATHQTPQFTVYQGVHKVGKWGLHHIDVYTNAGRLTLITEGRSVINVNLENKICNPCVFHTIDIPRIHGVIQIKDSLGHSQTIPT